MSSPRYVFVLGRRVGERLTPPWPGAGRTIETDAVPRSWVSWRLLGSNHRELARSAGVFLDVPACTASVAALRAAIEAGTVQTTVEAVDRLWGWVARVDDQPIAVAGRLYLRQRECEYSCQIFLEAAAAADVPTTAPLPRPQPTIEARVAAE